MPESNIAGARKSSAARQQGTGALNRQWCKVFVHLLLSLPLPCHLCSNLFLVSAENIPTEAPEHRNTNDSGDSKLPSWIEEDKEEEENGLRMWWSIFWQNHSMDWQSGELLYRELPDLSCSSCWYDSWAALVQFSCLFKWDYLCIDQ